jgi:hypothetical protein
MLTVCDACMQNLTEIRGATAATNASVSFGLIPREHWFQPNWIDEERAAEGRATMARKGMPYAGVIGYFVERRTITNI